MTIKANQLSVTTMQKRERALNVQGIDQGLSFQSPSSIGKAGIVSIALEIGYAILTANMTWPEGFERSMRLIVSGIRYPRNITLPIMLAPRTRLLILFRKSL